MRRCGIGLIFLAFCQLAAVSAQDLPPAVQAHRAGAIRQAVGTVPSPLGFAPGSRAAQRAAEANALAVPTPEQARKWLRTLTAEPHVAGTPADYKTALFVRDRLQEWGWKTELVSYDVLLNYPSGSASLHIKRPLAKKLELNEAPLAADKDSASSDAFGAFHGYGTSGTASGQVVYANYAAPRRLRGAREAGRLGQGQDRPGSLWRQLPRAEGSQCSKEWSSRDPDLFRSWRRRLRQRRCLPRRAVSSRLGDPARQRPVSLARSRRSLDAAWAVRQECRATAI